MIELFDCHMYLLIPCVISDKESKGEIYDDEQLSKPVKHFIAEFVRKKVASFYISLK